MPLQLARYLTSKESIVLHYENPFLIKTLVWHEHLKYRMNDSKNWENEFYLLIRRNGGIVEELNDDQKKILKVSGNKIRSDSRTHYNGLGLISDKCGIGDCVVEGGQQCLAQQLAGFVVCLHQHAQPLGQRLDVLRGVE